VRRTQGEVVPRVDTTKVRALTILLTTRAGLEAIDEAVRTLSDPELDAIVERARSRRCDPAEPQATPSRFRPRADFEP
jgi:hypothetical protein